MSYNQDIRNIFNYDIPWQKLDNSNILVTGATGLIGSCLVETLMMNPRINYNVYAAGRNEQRAKLRFAKYWSDSRFHFLKYDITDPIIADVDFDFIIHAASNSSPNFFAKSPVEVMKSNFDGVANLIDYGMNHNLKRFLYVSTGEVYGEGSGEVFKESSYGYVDILSPRSCYPSSKRAAETLCNAYADEYGVNVVIARPSHTYGPHFTENDNRVYAQFINNILRDEDIIMKSAGSQYRSWCYVVDCVSAILFILLKGESGQAYNIADTSSNITIKQLAELIAEIGHKNVSVQLPDYEERKGYNVVTKSIYDTSKLQKLGWHISGTMSEKMISTINEHRNG